MSSFLFAKNQKLTTNHHFQLDEKNFFHTLAILFKWKTMTRRCALTGKSPKAGNNRPFSLKATKRTFRPNLFYKRVFNPLTGRVEKMRLSAKAIRTLKKWAREGAAMAEASKEATKK